LEISDLIDKSKNWNAKYPQKDNAFIKMTFFKGISALKIIGQLFISSKTDSLTSAYCAN
jgi:hypothetical protein